jgi:hypothetical protein
MLPLDPNRSGFTWPNARACAERCALAYAGGSPGVDGIVAANQTTDTLALVMNEPDCISVAFRGSTNLRDWIQDLKFNKDQPRVELVSITGNDEAVMVHMGFMEDVDSVSTDIIAEVHKELKEHVDSVSAELIQAVRNVAGMQGAAAGGATAPTYPIFVTGHSKGGGEATLFALELERQGFNVRAVYTLGQPRVGNKAFAELYNATLQEETFRIVNQNDIVPSLPGVLMGYRHEGNEIFLPVGGGWDRNPSWWVKAFSDALGFWGAYRHRADVLLADHHIAAYQERIQLLV